MGKYREMTVKETKIAANAKQLFEKAKKDLGLTQSTAAKQLGMTQATFGQYLNGVIPMNTDFIIKLATLLGVHADKIDPQLRFTLDKVVSHPAPKRVPLIGTTSGNRVVGAIDLQFIADADNEQKFYAVMVDNEEYLPIYNAHTTLVVNPLGFLRPQDQVAVQLTKDNAYLIRALVELGAEVFTCTNLKTGGKEKYPLSMVKSVHKIAQVKLA